MRPSIRLPLTLHGVISLRSLLLPLLIVPGFLSNPVFGDSFSKDWESTPDRTWIGPEFWANRLHDWQVADGRLECIADRARLGFRNVHLLSVDLSETPGPFQFRVRTGSLIGEGTGLDRVPPSAASGFQFGIGQGQIDYRSAAIVHHWAGPGAGLFAGVTRGGRLEIRDRSEPNLEPLASEAIDASGLADEAGLLLTLEGTPLGADRSTYRLVVTASAVQAAEGEEDALEDLGSATVEVDAARLLGNIALTSHPGDRANVPVAGRFWFDDLEVVGDRVAAHPERALGPVICAQHTLSRDVLKMTAQLLPIGEGQPQSATLQVDNDGRWVDAATAEIIVPGYTATFRVEDWDSTRGTAYRVLYDDRAVFEGMIRPDPVDAEALVVAGFTGNHNNWHQIGAASSDWLGGVWFPHEDLTSKVDVHRPDLLFFSGDQVYEGDSPTFADSNPRYIKMDYLYKWYLWCWAYRDLTRDTPSICMPDDHDVFQGNIWGQGGRKSPDRDHDGGYVHPADFVKMVERTQTSHMPDPYDPTPVDQGIGVYYTNMVYGRISIAILEDRKFKSGCNRPDMPPSGTGRPDHFNDPDFDVDRLDIEGVELLGARQETFLRDWATDWAGADMKMAVSQTIFANMATHHGGNLFRLIADLDSNGWPQSGRNRAIGLLRRALTFHLGGDQHLATVVHHGIERHGDAIWSFCVPSVANFYPRAWAPELDGDYRVPEPEEYRGDRRDGFGHPVTVYAATNPGKPSGYEPAALHDQMPGYGIVRLNKVDRTITMTCWPRYADPNVDEPYPFWPITIDQTDNDGRTPAAYLPTLIVEGLPVGVDPVIEVIDEANGDLVYAYRVRGSSVRPQVYDAQSTYTVRVSEPDRGLESVLNGIEPGPATRVESVRVTLEP